VFTFARVDTILFVRLFIGRAAGAGHGARTWTAVSAGGAGSAGLELAWTSAAACGGAGVVAVVVVQADLVAATSGNDRQARRTSPA